MDIVHIRPYDHAQDYSRVYDFLVEIYRPGEVLRNWLAPRWEYMHFHSAILELDLSKIGLAESDRRILGVVHFESSHAEVYTQVRPGHEDLRSDLLDFAEENGYRDISRSRDKAVRLVFVNDFEHLFERIVATRGYERWEGFGEPHSRYRLDGEIPPPILPAGFRLQSLADENDIRKINRVLWRGFDHAGPPPVAEEESRRFGQRAPNFRKDLTIIAVAPTGEYVSYCGMYFVPANRVAYLEPLATDPGYRRMGLARAVVLESLHRVRELGAEVCWVGSGQPFYMALGFELEYTANVWAKLLE